MAVTAISLPLLDTSIAESIYKEITSRTSRYYYFLGKTLAWDTPGIPPIPSNSLVEQKEARNNIIITKEILPTDVSYVTRRIDWIANTTYDMFDDHYSDKLVGVNLLAGGSNYSNSPNVIITGGNGVGAQANAIVEDGVITTIVLEKEGYGYNTAPAVTFTDVSGTGASAVGVLSLPFSGAEDLASSNFYVMTDEYNVYLCLDNNNNANSTIKPTSISTDPFKLSDGYVWKYVYNVPPSLRNKFLTAGEMPVASAIRTPFFSGGEIKSVVITNRGQDYTTAGITVQGDGFLESNPVFITTVAVNNGGDSYTEANITIAPPFAGATPWAGDTEYGAGIRLIHDNNIYLVTKRGVSANANAAPFHTVGTAENYQLLLKYLGTTATGNVSVSSGNVASVELDGMLRTFSITTGGSGYLDEPTITVSGGGGSNAAAYAVISDNSLSTIVITDKGKNYTSTPTVIIGEEFANNTEYAANVQIAYLTNLYTVSVAGNTGSGAAPTHTSGEVTIGTANLAYAGTRAAATAVLQYGSGYQSRPSVTLTGDGNNANVTVTVLKSEAELTPILRNGQITGVRIDDGGIGYTFATLTVTGNGSNANVAVDFNEGQLDSLQSSVELLAVPGAVSALKIISNGYDYTAANVVITGDGSGATGNAIVSNGRVTKVNLLTPGSGYTQCNVMIYGDGSGASARAILPPVTGHGRNVVNELFADSLAFYSTISREKNQGLTVSNDYRQVGILKDIRRYNVFRFYERIVGSTCWLVSSTSVNVADFPNDTILTRTTDSARFAVVTTTSTGLLIQDLDGKPPVSGDSYLTPDLKALTISAVTAPDVDKYSGELLFLDNRLAFTATQEQTVSLKTIIKF